LLLLLALTLLLRCLLPPRLLSRRSRVSCVSLVPRHSFTRVVAVVYFDFVFVGSAIGPPAAEACGCLKYLAHRTAATGDALMIFWIIPRVGRLATRGLRLLDSL
jgi:hypothetical protein